MIVSWPMQGSDEWKAQRCGKATASRMSDLRARTKTGWGASRANYMAELIAETLTGVPADQYVNAAMKWGTEHEPDARDAYCFVTDWEAVQVGFIDHPTIPMCGASPDSLIGEEGLVEIKCPNTATHIETLLRQTVPDEYYQQMQWQMACTGRQWCDWVSFDPRMPEQLRLFIKRVMRDDPLIQIMSNDIITFQAEMADKVGKLKQIGGLL